MMIDYREELLGFITGFNGAGAVWQLTDDRQFGAIVSFACAVLSATVYALNRRMSPD
jgi:hypothetical protein